jgi:conjugal transfer/entry exclusion protein
MLVAHRIIDENQIAQLQGAKGFKNVAQDLQSLSRVLKDSWDKIQGKLPLTVDDLTRANQLAAHLLRTIGLREQGAGVEALHGEGTRESAGVS